MRPAAWCGNPLGIAACRLGCILWPRNKIFSIIGDPMAAGLAQQARIHRPKIRLLLKIAPRVFAVERQDPRLLFYHIIVPAANPGYGVLLVQIRKHKLEHWRNNQLQQLICQAERFSQKPLMPGQFTLDEFQSLENFCFLAIVLL